MGKKMRTEDIGVAAGKALGFTQEEMLAIATTSVKEAASLDERALSRLAKGRSSPQARTRLLILPISAEVLGLPREAIALEMYWRDTYDRLSEEIGKGSTPIALEGFLLHLIDIAEASDAAGAWNHAMASYMFADLQWDAMESESFAGLLGRSKQEIRQSCVIRFKLAYDLFSNFAAKVRSGAFGLQAGPAALIAARADSMKSVAAEQLFSLALLNEQGAWKLTINGADKALCVHETAELLPTDKELARFSSVLRDFLPGDGWIRRIDNNKAVISLALASAAVEADPIKAKTDSSLKLSCLAAIDALRSPCDGERVAPDALPTYKSVVRKGLVDAPAGGKRPKGCLAVAILAGLFFAAGLLTASVPSEPVKAMVSQIPVTDQPAALRLAGPGGTRPTRVAAIGPGGTVGTKLAV
ncbi:hypothetical protein [Bosea sp. RAC05]|jgi:hypothetical protein|uniref:hypothetical protein n=1 Tax=Bosea sp. RAC05 TaxID=1842539 RepID=UPI00083E4DD5|nr:hypothetical protein [Bosea sp. RAC05]AOG06129.1 hypothetical protein BSY19_195 [Bosea sp. RAC05]